jgi:hypothetical protein
MSKLIGIKHISQPKGGTPDIQFLVTISGADIENEIIKNLEPEDARDLRDYGCGLTVFKHDVRNKIKDWIIETTQDFELEENVYEIIVKQGFLKECLGER